ncbi:MAG TPA: DUF2079 domain-containing protein [bacterium]
MPPRSHPAVSTRPASLSGLDPVVAWLAGAGFAGWAVLLALRYWAFDFWDWDLAIFAQSLWNLSHGSLRNSIMDMNFFGNHANLAAFLFAPVYRLLPHPYLLLLAKAACCTLAVIPLAALIEPRCGRAAARWLAAAWLCYPPLTYALYYEFHYESLSPLLVLGMWLAYERGSRRGFAAAALACLLLKENLPLIVGLFGLMGLLRRPEKRWWALVSVVAAAWFAAAVFWLIPAARSGADSAYWTLYRHLGERPVDVLATVVSRPGYVWSILTDPVNRAWLWQLFAPVGLLALPGADALLLGAPVFLQHMLSSMGTQHTIKFHYGALLSPFVFMAAARGLGRIARVMRVRHAAGILGAAVFACAVVSQAAWGPAPDLLRARGANVMRDDLDWARAALLERMPERAPVVATFHFLPELSRRPELYAFHNAYMNRARMAESRPYELPEGVEALLIDANDPLMTNQLRRVPKLAQNLRAFFSRYEWRLEALIDSLMLFHPGDAPDGWVYQVSRDPVEVDPASAWTFEGGLRLLHPAEGTRWRGRPEEAVPAVLIWQLRERTDRAYGLWLIWVDGAGRRVKAHYHPIAYRIFPAWMWEPGHLIRERHGWRIPRGLPPGVYHILGRVAEESSQELLRLEGAPARAAGPETVLLGEVEVRP